MVCFCFYPSLRAKFLRLRLSSRSLGEDAGVKARFSRLRRFLTSCQRSSSRFGSQELRSSEAASCGGLPSFAALVRLGKAASSLPSSFSFLEGPDTWLLGGVQLT